MSDITYTIGAKDAASPTLNKVDASMQRLEKSSKDLGDAAERSLNRMSIGVDTLLKSTVVLYAFEKAVQLVGSAFSFIAGGVDDFNEAGASVDKLTTAMSQNNGATQESIDANIALADVMEKRLNVEAETIQSLMAQAANLGVANDKLDETTAAAIGLSEAMGVSLETGLKNARLAAEGNFKAFEKSVPAIKNMSTAEEKLAAVLELANKGLLQKEAYAQSAAGAGDRLSIKLGDLAEVIGGKLSPILDAGWNGISRVADVLVSMLEPALDSSGGTLQSWSDWAVKSIESLTNNVIAGLTMAEVIFQNFGAVVGIAFDWVKLKYETYRADTEHLFTVTLPAYVKWFGDEFYNLMDTAFSAVSTVIKNHFSKTSDMFLAFWDFIKSGGQTDLLGQLGEIAGRSYLDGFENSIGELPNVAERATTETERRLKESIDDSTNDLAKQFAEKLAGRQFKFGGGAGFGTDFGGGDLLGDIGKKSSGSSAGSVSLSATESRLLTRGPGSRMTPEELLKELITITKKGNADAGAQQAEIESAAREQAEALKSKGSVMFARPPL